MTVDADVYKQVDVTVYRSLRVTHIRRMKFSREPSLLARSPRSRFLFPRMTKCCLPSSGPTIRERIGRTKCARERQRWQLPPLDQYSHKEEKKKRNDKKLPRLDLNILSLNIRESSRRVYTGSGRLCTICTMKNNKK